MAAVLLTWAGSIATRFYNLPADAIFTSFSDLQKRNPELRGLIAARLHATVMELASDLNNLDDDGEDWSTANRLAVANSLLQGLGQVSRYWATSTDAPYESFYELEAFYRLQGEKLKSASVRRLLVYPLEELLENLAEAENRKQLTKFLRLHRRRRTIDGSGQRPITTNYQFDLRYWPRSLEDLRRELRASLGGNGDRPPILVDLAVVGDSLVFGQSANTEDKSRLSGPGFVLTGPHLTANYAGAFDRIWNSLKRECYPPAQLDSFIKLREMRDATRRRSQGQDSNLSGLSFFESTLRHIEGSASLRAIDVAPRTEYWFERSEYLSFLNSTIVSAKAHKEGFHARTFVLPEPLEELNARLFVNKVIRPQVEAGIEIYILFAEQLVEENLAAVDCIFSDSWGFYLLPLEDFDSSKVSSEKNMVDPILLTGYFAELFASLSNAAKFSCKSAESCNSPDLVEYLTAGSL